MDSYLALQSKAIWQMKGGGGGPPKKTKVAVIILGTYLVVESFRKMSQ